MKTEKEKMLGGEIFDRNNKQLLNRWHIAKCLTNVYNNAETNDSETQNLILYKLLGSKGKNSSIIAPFFCNYGENIHIGEKSEIDMNCSLFDSNTITIGDNVLISPNVQIHTVSYTTKESERVSTSSPVTIGSNVCLGAGSIVLPGVSIGNNSTIAAGSVVSESIPDNCLAGGNPCKIINQNL